MAKLYFRYGAMNCGKSTALMQVMHNYEERGMQAVLIKPSIDTKGGAKVVSRLGIEREVDIVLASGASVKEELANWTKGKGALHCVLVDEVQFLKSDQIDELFEIAVKQDLPVICYGLRTDFAMNGFEGSTRLLLLAHCIEELKTICRCGRKAVLNGRKVNDTFVFEGEQVGIDLEDNLTYESLCANCYFQLRES